MCEVCSTKFVSSYHLKRHMLIHTGERAFKCPYCDRPAFTQKGDLTGHLSKLIVHCSLMLGSSQRFSPFRNASGEKCISL